MISQRQSKTLKVGDRIQLKQAKEAWYSRYGTNLERIIQPDEIGTVTAINVPVVRKTDKRTTYHVASFGNDRAQADFNAGEYTRIKEPKRETLVQHDRRINREYKAALRRVQQIYRESALRTNGQTGA